VRWLTAYLAAGLALAGSADRSVAKPPAKVFEPTPGVLAEACRGPMADVERIVFATRSLVGDLHYYENYGRKYGQEFRLAEGGGRLCLLDVGSGEVTDLLADPDGAIRDPVLSWDAAKVLFAYRKGGTNHYHLYEMGLDGEGLRQVTDGPFDDVEPCYLPDGGIAFISTRCNRRVPCWSTQVGLLYRCQADGSGIRSLSAGVEHENTPWVLPDGRLLYTRWEYVDRDEVAYHHLWVVNPDGTRHMTFYGNMHKHGNCVAMLDAKPVPDSRKVACTFAFHNTAEHAGPVVLIDPDRGPDALDAARTVSQTYPAPLPRAKLKYNANAWRDPYPLGEDCLLVASQQTIYVMDGQGRAEPIFTLDHDDPRMWVHEPRPVVGRRRPPVFPSTVDRRQATGRLLLDDVSVGRNLPGVEDGEIKRLLVMEELPKPISHGVDPDRVSLQSTFILHRILGTVPVERDGSAHFDVPANRPVFFVALDAQGRSVKRMMSFTSVQPGEVTGCVGCHERRTRTAPASAQNKAPLASLRAPSRIEPVPGVPEVIDYVRDVQPIWDRHCVRCHNYETYAGKLSLTGDRAPTFTHSYLNLHWSDLLDLPDQGPGNLPPRSMGAATSQLHRTIADGNHHDVTLSDRELRLVEMWIESSGAYAGTYAMLGHRSTRVQTGDVLKRRCDRCHTRREMHRPYLTGRGRLMGRWWNLSHPARSLALLAPLSKDAGGLGLCRQRAASQKTRYQGDEPPAEVFASADDADYLALLAAIRAAARRVPEAWHPTMEGFALPRSYIEELKRFDLLDEAFDPRRDPLNAYQADDRYFRSLHHDPGVRAGDNDSKGTTDE
jgi:hypothetical protein